MGLVIPSQKNNPAGLKNYLGCIVMLNVELRNEELRRSPEVAVSKERHRKFHVRFAFSWVTLNLSQSLKVRADCTALTLDPCLSWPEEV